MKRNTIINLFIFVLWGISLTMLFLFQKQVTLPVSASDYSFPEEPQYMNIYMDGEKIGYSKTNYNEKYYGIEVQSEMVTRLEVLGVPVPVELSYSAQLGSQYSLQSFFGTIEGLNLSWHFKGERRGSNLHLEITQDGETIERVFKAENWHLPVTFEPFLFSQNLEPGTKYRFNIFSPTNMDAQEIGLEFIQYENISIDEKTYYAKKLAVYYEDRTAYYWISEAGELLKEEMGNLERVKTTEAGALGDEVIKN